MREVGRERTLVTENSPVSKSRASIVLTSICFGVVLVAADSTSMTVALPNIKDGLRLTQTDLGWVLSAFLLTYTAFRLIGGHLSDLYGSRSLFLKGLIVFVAASIFAGIASSRLQLITARTVQGAAGAIIVTSALALIADIFTKTEERARAVAAYGVSAGGGGAIGIMLGGILTSEFGWRCVFLVNLPIGIVAYVSSYLSLPERDRLKGVRPLDVAGSITATASLAVVTFAILERGSSNLSEIESALLLLFSAILAVLFFVIESRTADPLLPISVFRKANLLRCCVINLLFSSTGAAAVFASLYLQLVLHYDPFKAGVAFLPLTLATALFSLSRAIRTTAAADIRRPIVAGLVLLAGGLVFLCGTSVNGNVAVSVIPGLTLIGVGGGVVLSPLFIATMTDVEIKETGVVSGIYGTTASMGRVLGLALLVNIATTRTNGLLTKGVSSLAALTSGYHSAFIAAAVLATIAAALSSTLTRNNM